jgi:hypothetical protein
MADSRLPLADALDDLLQVMFEFVAGYGVRAVYFVHDFAFYAACGNRNQNIRFRQDFNLVPILFDLNLSLTQKDEPQEQNQVAEPWTCAFSFGSPKG